MSGFLFAFVAVALAGVGARDVRLVAALTMRQGARPGILLTAIATSLAAAAAAGWAAAWIVPLLPADARVILAGMALALAGGEMLLAGARRATPREPTNSLGALALVLFAQQLADAARFLVLGISVATAAPLAAGAGGALGGVAAVAAAWMLPDAAASVRVTPIRRAVGAVLLAVALVVALKGLGRL